MNANELLRDLVLVMGTCLVSLIALRPLRVPPLVGFLAAGILIGPGGLGLVHDRASIDNLANVGIVFLLFTIGLQFSVRDLLAMSRYVFGGGALQVALTVLLVGGALHVAGIPVRQASYLGVMVAMSSTAILLRALDERGELGAAHGRFMLSVSLFQDVLVVPLILFLPLWAGGPGVDMEEAWLALARTLGLLIALFLTARFLLPLLLNCVVTLRSREAFTLATLVGALGTAWVCGEFGVSLALGAFLAGIVLADSEYAHQVLSEVTPLRDGLASLFFASVGMLVQPRLWLEQPLLSLGLVVGAIALKAVAATVAGRAVGLSTRAATLGALGLSQVGEFSFVLALMGGQAGLFQQVHEPAFLSVAVLSMAVVPLVLRAAPRLASGLSRPGRVEGGTEEDVAEAPADHVVVVGYGVSGRNVTRVLKRHAVRHVVLEMNPGTVRRIRGEVDRVLYGDATQEEVLRRAGILDARVLLVAIPDPAASRQIVAVAKKLRPDLFVVVRTRLVAEVQALRELGATSVVPEELETSLELASRVLAAFGVPERVLGREKAAIRREGYGVLLQQGLGMGGAPDLDDLLSELDMTYVALPTGSPVLGRSLKELDLRRATGATVVAIQRQGRSLANPGPDTRLEAGDVVAAVGDRQQVLALRQALGEA